MTLNIFGLVTLWAGLSMYGITQELSGTTQFVLL